MSKMPENETIQMEWRHNPIYVEPERRTDEFDVETRFGAQPTPMWLVFSQILAGEEE